MSLETPIDARGEASQPREIKGPRRRRSLSASPTEEAIDEPGDRRGAPVADGQGDALLQRAKRRGSDEVGRLEELPEGQLLALGLQQEAAPLVERRRAEAAEDHDDEQHLWRSLGPHRLERDHHVRGVVAEPAIGDIADHGGEPGLVDVGPIHIELHGLAVAVVGDGQRRAGEDEAGEEGAGAVAQRQHVADGVDGLEEGELQEVGGQRRLEEVQHHGGLDVLDGIHDLHALHEHAVDDRLPHRGENRLDDRGDGTRAHGVQHPVPDGAEAILADRLALRTGDLAVHLRHPGAAHEGPRGARALDVDHLGALRRGAALRLRHGEVRRGQRAQGEGGEGHGKEQPAAGLGTGTLGGGHGC
mmetsp:Transcript_96792/g.250351  ORF Transcript_96792/g.250351 Transcript_96792/m.250351 type:complete len:359 (+) Transcript_96792:172-1248(+)